MDEESLEFGAEEVSVVDVYDIASEIGKECEKIIDCYGAESMTALMPRVINALELLETLASRNERENTQVAALQTKIAQLECDKLEKAEYRRKFERELEAIEDQWRAESKELVAVVTRLQEENRRLVRDLSPNHRPLNAAGNPDSNQSRNGVGDEEDLLEKLRTSVERQRDELRAKERELEEKMSLVEELRMQLEKVGAASKELRRKQKNSQGQVRTLCEERADFLVKLQEQQRDITSLRQRLGLAQKENEDLVKSDVITSESSSLFAKTESDNEARFTADELKELLNERNALKARVNDLEEELESYRPKKDIAPSQPETEDVEEDAPVQGPLPCEPDDAPWKRCSESGIRKFFRKIFTESGGGGGFPRRSLSTLSKMALASTHNDPVAV